jgi:D-glycero-D-manno-heptose 1,7-bisphosphate phosphatase
LPTSALRRARRAASPCVSTVFLDRDGVINENRVDHVTRWAEFRFLPGAPEAVARLCQAGLRLFVVTNQAIINRGLASSGTIDAVNQRMVRELQRRGGRIEAVAYCPHRPEEQCACRKPRPGLLLDLARRYGVDLRAAAVVGDALTDIQAGQAVGCQTVLVLTGRGRHELRRAALSGANGFRVAPDLDGAVDLLVQQTLAR